jgi:membrane protein DedA with SNARE-associated domain
MIGEEIIDAFASLGDVGMILALVAIILIDGTGVPTLPEVWMVWIFGVHFDSLGWAVLLITVASIASLGGNFILYSVVKLIGMPKRIQKVMRKYTDFLIVSDERLLLLNRVAPLVPYTGAFIAVLNWDLRKCVLYLIIGAMAKSTVVIALAWLSYDNLRQDVAPWVALIAVAVVILISIVASVIYKRRIGVGGGTSRSQS